MDLLSGFARDGFGSYDTLTGIEGVVGSDAGDIIYGTNSADVRPAAAATIRSSPGTERTISMGAPATM